MTYKLYHSLMISTGLPIPPRGNPLTDAAKNLAKGSSIDVASRREEVYLGQAITGFRTKTGKKSCQRKLVNEGEHKTDVVPAGEVFWRVWRIL